MRSFNLIFWRDCARVCMIVFVFLFAFVVLLRCCLLILYWFLLIVYFLLVCSSTPSFVFCVCRSVVRVCVCVCVCVCACVCLWWCVHYMNGNIRVNHVIINFVWFVYLFWIICIYEFANSNPIIYLFLMVAVFLYICQCLMPRGCATGMCKYVASHHAISNSILRKRFQRLPDCMWMQRWIWISELFTRLVCIQFMLFNDIG